MAKEDDVVAAAMAKPIREGYPWLFLVELLWLISPVTILVILTYLYLVIFA